MTTDRPERASDPTEPDRTPSPPDATSTFAPSPDPIHDPIGDPVRDTAPAQPAFGGEPGRDATGVLTEERLPDGATQEPTDHAAAGASPAVDTGRRPVRMPTVALGLVLLVLSVALPVAATTDVDVDFGLVVIGLMIVVGVLLLVGSRRAD